MLLIIDPHATFNVSSQSFAQLKSLFQSCSAIIRRVNLGTQLRNLLTLLVSFFHSQHQRISEVFFNVFSSFELMIFRFETRNIIFCVLPLNLNELVQVMGSG
jgi:hypothetical protein